MTSDSFHELYYECLLPCSWFSPNNWSQSCRKDSQPSENQEPGCGRKNPSRNSKSETVQTSTYHQVVPGTKSMDWSYNLVDTFHILLNAHHIVN